MFGLACVDMKSSSAFSFRILITLLLFVCLFVAVSILEFRQFVRSKQHPVEGTTRCGCDAYSKELSFWNISQ